MPFRKSFVVAALVALTAAPIAAFQAKAVDLTGSWSGTFTRVGGSEGTAYLALTQKGAELTGTAGPTQDQQANLANGKVTTVKDVTTVTFDVTQPNGLVLKFDLKVVDGRLKGAVTGEQNGEKREAVLDVGRTK